MNHKFFQSEKFNGMQNDEIYGYLESSDDLLIKGDVNGDVFFAEGQFTAAVPLPEISGQIKCSYTTPMSQGILHAEKS